VDTVTRVQELVEPVVLAADATSTTSSSTAACSASPSRPPVASTSASSPASPARSRGCSTSSDPIAGQYTLEVSSPGLERALRRPQHFAGAVGSLVAIKTHPGVEGDRRVRGTLVASDDRSVTVALADGEPGATRVLALDQIERARTVFEWGPAPKPGGPRPKSAASGRPASKPSAREEGSEAMSNDDMMEALRALASEKGITPETLMGALADALESAYKRLPGAYEYAWATIDPVTGEMRVTAQELDEDGEPFGPELDVTPDQATLGRIAAQTFKQVMMQRLREVDREMKYEEYAGPRGRHRHGHHPADRRPLHPARPGSGGGAAAAGRAGALRAAREQQPPEGVHRRGPQDGQGPPDRGEPHAPGPDQAPVRARGPRDRGRHRRDQGVRPRARPPHQDRRLVQRHRTSTRWAPAWAPAVLGSAWS
jgi:hypothetical protein